MNSRVAVGLVDIKKSTTEKKVYLNIRGVYLHVTKGPFNRIMKKIKLELFNLNKLIH